jgi:quinol monooxygenase YgiN
MKFLPISIIFLMWTIIGVSIASADVYTWVDENGVRHYSDSPPESAQDAKVMFEEYAHDEAADKARTAKDKQQLDRLFRELEADQSRVRQKAQQEQRKKKPTRQEMIAAEKERLEKKIAFLEKQPLEYFGSQRNKMVRIGFYRYQMQDLMKDPDKYFNQPAQFEGNVKPAPTGEEGHASGGAGF